MQPFARAHHESKEWIPQIETPAFSTITGTNYPGTVEAACVRKTLGTRLETGRA